MNDIINKFLLAGDKFMPEMHLRQPAVLDKPGFNYSACGPFTKNKEKIKKFKVTGDSRYIYQNQLDKACFQHDTVYGDFKDLAKRTTADKVLRNKAFNVAKDPKYDGYQRGLASVVYKFFDKKTKGSGLSYTNKPMSPNEQLAEELHKPIIKKFAKRRVHSAFNIYKHMTSISKNVYIDKLDDIVNEYSNTYHRIIKMKPIDVKDNTYANTGKEVNDKDLKFKVGDHVRISKYKNIFAKGYTPNWSEEAFVIKEIKSTAPWTYVINDLNGEEIIGTFYEKELQKTNQQEFRIEKVIKKRKDMERINKWKGYNNSFNIWIDKKDIV